MTMMVTLLTGPARIAMVQAMTKRMSPASGAGAGDTFLDMSRHAV